MELLKQVAAAQIAPTEIEEKSSVVQTEDDVFAEAVAKAKTKLNISEAAYDDDAKAEEAHKEDNTDKGTYGSRQVEFKQDVWRIPDKPSGDVSQPVGLLTQADLNNYVLFKKGDRLNFKWKSGTAGQAKYDAVRNGDVSVDANIVWTDALIRELEDEGALDLVAQ